jgi:hypothetical protein
VEIDGEAYCLRGRWRDGFTVVAELARLCIYYPRRVLSGYKKVPSAVSLIIISGPDHLLSVTAKIRLLFPPAVTPFPGGFRRYVN